MTAKILAASVLVIGLTLTSRTAGAWEQTESDLGYPLAWYGSCFHYSINSAGSDDIEFNELSAIVRDAFDSWQDVGCSYFGFVGTEPATVDEQAFHEDAGNVNLLVWRETEEDWPYGPLVVGLTSVHYDPTTGEILDVDIELNGYDFEFSTLDEYPEGSPLIDVQSTLTHEIGHSVGLAHSAVAGATMSAYGDPGTTDKRSLSQDDIDGLCALYPLADDPGVCEEPLCGLDLDGDSEACEITGADDEGCGCAATGARRGRTQALLGALLGSLV